MSDHELLSTYVRDGSQPAFAALVERHLNLVYSVARRHVRDVAAAQDVTQTVFIELARHAHEIKPGAPLVAWLHLVSRRTALNTLRGNARRQAREQAAGALAALDLSPMPPDPSAWNEIAPLLDEAVEALPTADRTALLLRFFENKSFREVGAALQISDDAAQKRVTRALDQLRTFFLRRGIAIGSAAAFATELSAHALELAPATFNAGLVATAATSAAGPLTAAAPATSIAMTTLQKTALTAVALLAVGGAVFETHALQAQRDELAALRGQADALAVSLAKPARRAAAVPVAAPAAVDLSPLVPEPALEAAMAGWLDRVARLKHLRDNRPELVVPEIRILSDEAFFDLARDAKLETEDQVRDALAMLRSRAEADFMRQLQSALRRYLEAKGGTLPASPRELHPFLQNDVPPETLARYHMLQQGRAKDFGPNEYLIAQTKPVDWLRDREWQISLQSTNARDIFSTAVEAARKAYAEANGGKAATKAEDILPLLPGPVDPARVQPYFTPRR